MFPINFLFDFAIDPARGSPLDFAQAPLLAMQAATKKTALVGVPVFVGGKPRAYQFLSRLIHRQPPAPPPPPPG